ncbi:MAG: hypothetical protein ABIT01_12830 [Thermoanaerobaculia bacterium]
MRSLFLLLLASCAIACGRTAETPSQPTRPVPADPGVAPAAAAPVAAPAAPVAANRPAGSLRLRGLKWGDPVPPGFRILSKQSESESAYFDPKEKLVVEGVSVLDISYRFIDSRFSAMAIQGTPPNFPPLIAALRKKWGAPAEEDPGRVKWMDAETTALAALSEPDKPFVLIVIDSAAVERARPK